MRFSLRRWIKHFSIRGEPRRGARRSRCFCKQYYPLLPPKWKSTVWGCHRFGDKPWKMEGSVIVVLWQAGHNAIFPLRWCSTYPVLLVTDVPRQLGERREDASAWCKIGPLCLCASARKTLITCWVVHGILESCFYVSEWMESSLRTDFRRYSACVFCMLEFHACWMGSLEILSDTLKKAASELTDLEFHICAFMFHIPLS